MHLRLNITITIRFIKMKSKLYKRNKNKKKETTDEYNRKNNPLYLYFSIYIFTPALKFWGFLILNYKNLKFYMIFQHKNLNTINETVKPLAIFRNLQERYGYSFMLY